MTSKNDEFEFKQRENEQLKSKNIDLENIIQSLKSVNDVQKQINHDHEINQELWKRKQDDFEQFQRVRHFVQFSFSSSFSCLFVDARRDKTRTSGNNSTTSSRKIAFRQNIFFFNFYLGENLRFGTKNGTTSD